MAELAERARVSLATLKRIEGGSLSTSLGAWLAVFERVGLMSRLTELRDPVSEALLNETRASDGEAWAMRDRLSLSARLRRHGVPVHEAADGGAVVFDVDQEGVVALGESGATSSTLAPAAC
ncbi:hypothetical protein RLIN73S_00663 [Rhodanobacter lindaniclasticus]